MTQLDARSLHRDLHSPRPSTAGLRMSLPNSCNTPVSVRVRDERETDNAARDTQGLFAGKCWMSLAAAP